MIRRATPADADALSVLARECFTQTFGHLYTPGDLTVFLDQAYSPAVLRSELQDPQRATWLLFEDAVDGSPSPNEVSCTPGDLVSSPGPSVHIPGEHPTAPYSGEEAPASFPDGLIGYVTAWRRRGPAPLHSARIPGRRPRNPPAAHRAGVARTRRAAHPLDRRVERKPWGAALLRAPRLRDRRRVFLHGRRPRRPRVHHPPPGERLTPIV